MRKEYLNKYWVLLHCYDDRLQSLSQLCQRVTLEEGQDTATISSILASEDIREKFLHADILVGLCTRINSAVSRECKQFAQAGKIVLLCFVGRPPAADWADLKMSIEHGVPGASAWSVPGTDGRNFLGSYLTRLNRAARLLDAGQVDQATNPFISRFVRRLSRWQILEGRLDQNTKLKRAAADFFLDLYLEPLVKAGIRRLFFESGSSIAFLGERFLARLNEESVQLRTLKLKIETNNILCFMEFIEAKSVELKLFPDGPPETKYGATFGSLGSVLPERGPLSSKARDALDEVKSNFARYKEDGIILGATSGIDLRPRRAHPGPHVGSFQNMLLKRAILESGAPAVLFLDEDKLPCEFIPGRCFSVCDKSFTWNNVCDSVPLALVCAFSNEEKGRRVLPALARLGFAKVLRSRANETPWCMIAMNGPFAATELATMALADYRA